MSWNDISNYINKDQDLLKYYLTDNKIINAFYKNIENNIKYEKFQEALEQLKTTHLQIRLIFLKFINNYY